MTDTLTTVLALIVLFIALPVLLLRLNDRRRKRHSRRNSAAEAGGHQQFEARLLDPDWSAVERQLRRSVPAELRQLYTDRSVIVSCGVGYGDENLSFEPLDEPALRENSRWLGFEAVTFAKNSFGDAIYLRCGAGEADRIYLTHHDGGDTRVLAESVVELVNGIRR